MAIIYNRDGTVSLISDSDPAAVATIEAGTSQDEISEAIDAFFNNKTWLQASMTWLKGWLT